MKRSFAGPRLAGLILLAASVAILLAVFAIPGRGGYSTSGPRFVPLIVAAGLIALSAAFLRAHVRAAGHGAGGALGRGGRRHPLGDARAAAGRR